jgi:hypothetical protein
MKKDRAALFERILKIVSKQPGYYVVEETTRHGPYATADRAADKWAERGFLGEIKYFDGKEMAYPK